MTDTKKLSKNLVLAIDWAAAEYKYLEDLRAELKKVETEKEIKKELEELRKAVKILHYVARAERRAYRFEQEVGKELEKLLAELEGENLSVDLITGFRSFISQFKIEEEQLVKLASFYEGTLEKELQQAQALEEVRKHIASENPKKAEEIHSSFLHILHGFEHQVDEAETWIAGLEVTLRKGKEMVGKLSPEEKGHLLDEGYRILKKYQFPIEKYPKEAEFMAQHPSYLIDITHAAATPIKEFYFDEEVNCLDCLFQDALPSCAKAGIITPEFWSRVVNGLISIEHSTNNEVAAQIFYFPFRIFEEVGMITPKYWEKIIQGVITMAQASGKNASDLLGKGFGACVDAGIIRPEYWDGLVIMAKAAESQALDLFKKGFSYWVRDGTIQPEKWDLLVLMVRMAGKNSAWLFEWTDIIGDLLVINKKEDKININQKKNLSDKVWPVALKYFSEMTTKRMHLDEFGTDFDTKYSFRGSIYLFINLFPRYQNAILSKSSLIQVSSKLGPIRQPVERLITLLDDLITSITWPSIEEFLYTIKDSKQKTSQLSTVLQGADPRTKTFMLYLILVRPRQALDIFSTYALLPFLEIEHKAELELLNALATPLLLKERNSYALATVLTPLVVLPSRERAVLLSALERSVKGFSKQDMRSFFVQSLPDFEISQYSFVELSYLFFLLVNEPGIKADKLQAKLQKMKKNAGKVLGLARKKWDDLSDMEKKLLRSGILGITELFFEPVLKMATTMIFDKIQQKLMVEFQVDRIPHIEDKTRNPSFHNALRVFKRMVLEKEYDDIQPLAHELIRQYLMGKTYPLTKNILECYPWTLAENQAWLKAHLKNKWWLKGFKLTRSLSQNEEKDNHAERIEHHLREAHALFEKLEINLPQINIQEVDKAYLKIKDNPKIDQAILSDLKTQVLALRKLQAGQSFSKASRATIEPEFNPLEILQMGNYVAGSCLAVDGVNYWSTIVNASEVNKRVLWAKDEAGNIIGRMLIAVDEDNKIVAFPIYYATDQRLKAIFNEYLIQLAKKCGFGINGKKNKVKRIFGTDWYTDGEVEIIEQAGSGN